MTPEVKQIAAIAGGWFLGEVVATAGGEHPSGPVQVQREDVLTVYIAARQVIGETNGIWSTPSRVNKAGVAFYHPITTYRNADDIQRSILSFARKLGDDLPITPFRIATIQEQFFDTETVRTRFKAGARRFDRKMARIRADMIADSGKSQIFAATAKTWQELASFAELGDTLPHKYTGRYWDAVREMFILMNSFSFDSDATASTLWREMLRSAPDAPATLADWAARAGKKVIGTGARAVGVVVREILSELGIPIAIGIGVLVAFKAVEKRIAT